MVLAFESDRAALTLTRRLGFDKVRGATDWRHTIAQSASPGSASSSDFRPVGATYTDMSASD
jgi:hypothetical protein